MKFEDMAVGYANMWSTMKIVPRWLTTVQSIVTLLRADKARYEAVARDIGCPWYMVAIVHSLESGRNFKTHLHNGDPLTARTVHVPAGQPATGQPPFTWEYSALDALRSKGWHQITDWSIPRCLYEFERYNGFGYVGKGVNSAYVWSFSSHQQPGKYVADGVWDADYVSQQCGAAVLLKLILDGEPATAPAPSVLVQTPTPEIQMPLPLGDETKGNPVKDLEEFMPLIGAVAPVVVTMFGGPLAGIAVKALADELGAKDTSATGVASAMKASPVAAVVKALQAVDEALKPVWQQAQAEPVPAPTPASVPPVATPAPSPNGVLVDPEATVTKSLVAGVLFVLTSLLIRDVALAHSLADMLAPAVEALLTGLGGTAITWLLRRSVINANANTVAALK